MLKWAIKAVNIIIIITVIIIIIIIIIFDHFMCHLIC